MSQRAFVTLPRRLLAVALMLGALVASWQGFSGTWHLHLDDHRSLFHSHHHLAEHGHSSGGHHHAGHPGDDHHHGPAPHGQHAHHGEPHHHGNPHHQSKQAPREEPAEEGGEGTTIYVSLAMQTRVQQAAALLLGEPPPSLAAASLDGPAILHGRASEPAAPRGPPA